MSISDLEEYNNIIKKYKKHPKVLELNNYIHHGITRLEHSERVALYTYKITKRLKLNYKSATKAALLHDFFFDEVSDKSSIERLTNHPMIALNNANKYFELNKLEEDIISKHMFPITFRIPKYIESWIVDGIDDVCAIYERIYSIKWNILSYSNLIIVLMIGLIRH